MNRNKQRAMLKSKREIGFHDLSGAPTIPITTAPPSPTCIKWRGPVKVQYSQAGAEAYLVYNEDQSIKHEFRRSQYTRAEWNKLLARLGMHPVQFWAAMLYEGGELEFVARCASEAW